MLFDLLEKGDMEAAFLEGPLSEEIYIKIPPGLEKFKKIVKRY